MIATSGPEPDQAESSPMSLCGTDPGLAGAVAVAPVFDVGAASHPGKVRRANEDSYLVSPAAGIFAVADGMGGHEAGALASSTVVRFLDSIGPSVSAADLLARLEDRLLRANIALRDIATQRGRTVGSTVAILLIFDRHFACVWSGDSRVYRVRGQEITQLSRDHTEVRELMDRGVLTQEEARTWPRRHVITRAIGANAEPELELEQGDVHFGDIFVICSDGLTGHVSDAEILGSLKLGSAQQVSDALIALTLERGATDNVTVVVVRYCHDAPRPGFGEAGRRSPGTETVVTVRNGGGSP